MLFDVIVALLAIITNFTGFYAAVETTHPTVNG